MFTILDTGSESYLHGHIMSSKSVVFIDYNISYHPDNKSKFHQVVVTYTVWTVYSHIIDMNT